MNWIPAFAGMTDDYWIPPAFAGLGAVYSGACRMRWYDKGCGYDSGLRSITFRNFFQCKAGYIKHHIPSAQS